MLGAIGLKLLGIWLPIKEIVKENWKIIAAIVLLIFVVWKVNDYISDVKETAYNKGVVAERTLWEARIKAEDKKNREFEKQLNSAIEKFGKSTAKQAADRAARATVEREKIKTIISTNSKYQDCVVGEDLLKARNNIRAEGPTGKGS